MHDQRHECAFDDCTSGSVCRYFKPSPEAMAELTSLLAPGGRYR